MGFNALRRIDGTGHQHIGTQVLEALPQVHAVGPMDDGFKNLAMPQRVFQEARQHAVVVQHGADEDGVHTVIGRPEVEYAGRNEALQLVALGGRGDVLVIFDVVHDGQIGPVRAVATAPDFFGTAKRFHLAAVCCNDDAGAPDFALPAGLRKITRDTGVGFQFGFDGFQHFGGLLEGVHDDDGVVLGAGDDAPEHKAHADLGGLGFAARGSDGVALARRRIDDDWQALVQVFVQSAGGSLAVVREVVLIPKSEAAQGVADAAAALGYGGSADVPAVEVGVNLAAQVIGELRQALNKLFAVLGHVTSPWPALVQTAPAFLPMQLSAVGSGFAQTT